MPKIAERKYRRPSNRRLAPVRIDLKDDKGQLRKFPSTASRAARLVDWFAYAVSPKWGKARQIERRMWPLQEARIEGAASKFEAANYDRRHHDRWKTSGLTDDDDFDFGESLDVMRQKSQHMIDNNALAAAAARKWVTYTVGPGMRPQARITAEDGLVTDSRAKDINRSLEQIFAEWAPRAEVSGKLSFGELQGEAAWDRFESGEGIALKSRIPDPQAPIPLKLQTIAPERLFTPLERMNDPRVRAGIERDELGRILGYFVSRTHPDDIKDVRGGFDMRRLPAGDVFHLYRRRRRRSRGVPELAPVILKLQTLDDWLDGWLENLDIASCFSVFITLTGDAMGAALANASDTEPETNDPIEDLDHGRAYYLNPGESVEFGNPQPANDTFDPFLVWLCRLIGNAIGYGYELLAGDWSKSNFSSTRLALLDARRNFQLDQIIMVERFLQPVWREIVADSITADLIPLSMREYNANRFAFEKCWWAPPPNPWVDPLKEVQASMLEVEAGFNSLPNVCAENGLDWQEVAEQNLRVEEWYTENGLVRGRSTKAVSGVPSAPKSPDGMDQDEDEDTEQRKPVKLVNVRRFSRNGHRAA